MVNIIHLNILFGIMITVLLDYYVYLFHKRRVILINSIKIKQKCLLWLKIYNFTKKYGKKLKN